MSGGNACSLMHATVAIAQGGGALHLGVDSKGAVLQRSIVILEPQSCRRALRMERRDDGRARCGVSHEFERRRVRLLRLLMHMSRCLMITDGKFVKAWPFRGTCSNSRVFAAVFAVSMARSSLRACFIARAASESSGSRRSASRKCFCACGSVRAVGMMVRGGNHRETFIKAKERAARPPRQRSDLVEVRREHQRGATQHIRLADVRIRLDHITCRT